MDINLNGIPFTLLKEKALWNAKDETLFIADVHLGKAMHFRKSGIAITASVQTEDYTKLSHLFKKYNPKVVYFLGDLFHSSLNEDWKNFESLILSQQFIKFVLIKGNHDIINQTLFKDLHIEVINDYLEDENFIYSHKPVDFLHTKINIAGHIHPGTVLEGFAKQTHKVPVFCLSDKTFLLPAFGRLTGLQLIPKSESNKIYLILETEVKLLVK